MPSSWLWKLEKGRKQTSKKVSLTVGATSTTEGEARTKEKEKERKQKANRKTKTKANYTKDYQRIQKRDQR